MIFDYEINWAGVAPDDHLSKATYGLMTELTAVELLRIVPYYEDVEANTIRFLWIWSPACRHADLTLRLDEENGFTITYSYLGRQQTRTFPLADPLAFETIADICREFVRCHGKLHSSGACRWNQKK